jgi:general secretion pathway protein G
MRTPCLRGSCSHFLFPNPDQRDILTSAAGCGLNLRHSAGILTVGIFGFCQYWQTRIINSDARRGNKGRIGIPYTGDLCLKTWQREYEMRQQRGFTLIELLVVITIIGILAAIAIPNMTKVRIKAKESEVKANLHVIQEAVERFYTNENEYPAYLLGGSNTAWGVFKGRPGNPNAALYDPLIEFAYVETYPKNPFIDEDKGGLYLQQSGGDLVTPASGDPRFGVKGTTMPNSVDDPMFFTTTMGNTDYAETINLNGTPQIINYGRFGGMLLGSGEPVVNTIPGSFFYRAEGPVDLAGSALSGSPTKRDFVYQNYQRYMLGGFGHETTKGLDVIRLTGQGDYRIEPGITFGYAVPLALPEVFGGGDRQNNPYFPYEPATDGAPFPYGAPDGLEDGIIITLTDSGQSLNF